MSEVGKSVIRRGKCSCDDCERKRVKRRKTIKQTGLASAIASAIALASPFIQHWEGKRNVTYQDLAGVPTACFGHTGDDAGPLGRVWTDAQCDILLRADIAAHVDPIIACVPALAGRVDQLAASTSLAFNIGTGAFCRSTAARRFNADDWQGGCDAFLLWVKVQGRTVGGLVARRRAERDRCLRNLPMPFHPA